MGEVLTESIRWVNLPYTSLLGGLVIYWLFVALGVLHLGEGDAHAELGAGDAPATIDGHGGGSGDGVDGHGSHGHHGGAGVWSHLFHFVNIGEVPALIVFSVIALALWLGSMIGNHYLNPHSSWLLSLAFFVPNLILSCVLARYLTMPFKKVFGALNREYDEHKPLVGRTCTVITSEVTSDFGQAQVETRGAPLLINVRAAADQLLRHGDTGVIVKEDREKATYEVVRFTL